MKKLLFFLLFPCMLNAAGTSSSGVSISGGVAAPAGESWYFDSIGYGQLIHASRNYQDETGFYVIEFEYDSSSCSIPATYPAGQPHYSALITVYQIIDGKKEIIGEQFNGQFTQDGCFEDDSKSLVETAKTMRDSK